MPKPRCPLFGCENDATTMAAYDLHHVARRLRLCVCADHWRALHQLGWVLEVTTEVDEPAKREVL